MSVLPVLLSAAQSNAAATAIISLWTDYASPWWKQQRESKKRLVAVLFPLLLFLVLDISVIMVYMNDLIHSNNQYAKNVLDNPTLPDPCPPYAPTRPWNGDTLCYDGLSQYTRSLKDASLYFALCIPALICSVLAMFDKTDVRSLYLISVLKTAAQYPFILLIFKYDWSEHGALFWCVYVGALLFVSLLVFVSDLRFIDSSVLPPWLSRLPSLFAVPLLWDTILCILKLKPWLDDRWPSAWLFTLLYASCIGMEVVIRYSTKEAELMLRPNTGGVEMEVHQSLPLLPGVEELYDSRRA